jgi:hypothetical protein
MSDDISEVGGFEPREYMGMFLVTRLLQRPDLEGHELVGTLGVYRRYATKKPFHFYLIDDENGHYFLAREELYNEAERLVT